MRGRRLPDGNPPWPPPKGAYWRDANGNWLAMTPNGLLAGLGLHDVQEHADRTITVRPSIETTHRGRNGKASYHGYLERGEWRDCQ